MLRPLPLLIALATVLAPGWLVGEWTGRWQPPGDLQAAVASVSHVPLSFGEWHGEPVEVDEQQFIQAGAMSHWTRVYHGQGVTFTVILMCGPTGRMAVHTPDVCYQGVGYLMNGAAARESVDDEATFWSAVFRKEEATGISNLRIFWSWKSIGEWKAPEQPRWTFRGAHYLYKLYVVRETSSGERPQINEEFLRSLTEALDKSLAVGETTR